MTDNNKDIDLSRRKVLGATFGLPALGAVGVGLSAAAADSGADNISTMTATDGTDTAAGVTVDFPGKRHPLSNESFSSLTLDPDLLSVLSVSVGDQIRIRRSENEYAVYTVKDAFQEDDDSTIRISRLARARLDVENTVWAKLGDNPDACPDLLGSSELTGEVFDAVADPVVATDLSESEAKSQGELIERLDGDGSQLAILAPHGGDIEQRTDDQAEALALDTACDFTAWRAKGYRSGTGAFLRWHVPSTQISFGSFPKLAAMSDVTYDYGVSFHGTCTKRIRIGGGADESLKAAVRDAINEKLPAKVADAVVDSGRYAATGDDVLVNRVSDNGVWIGQPKEVRSDHWEAVAAGVTQAYDQRAD